MAETPNQYLFVFGLKRQTEPFHICHYLCIESCFQVNRPERILFYYQHEPYGRYWDLAKRRLTLVHVQPGPALAGFRYGWRHRGCRKYRYAHLSDFMRLEKLIEQGGVYADIDTIFVNPLPAALLREPFVLGREQPVRCQDTGLVRPSLCNALIVSPREAEFGRRWLEEMPRAFNGSWSNHSTFLPQRLSEEIPHAIHIEPSRSFYPCMWTAEGIRTMLQGCDPDTRGIYSMHLWSHLWWSKRRRDLSEFHAGLLTERYIREVDTTYNLIARQFLPHEQAMKRDSTRVRLATLLTWGSGRR
ncbi:MAG: glycosyltransferase [Acidobacteriota bacterium]